MYRKKQEHRPRTGKEMKERKNLEEKILNID